jgi:hypothetical protein
MDGELIFASFGGWSSATPWLAQNLGARGTRPSEMADSPLAT